MIAWILMLAQTAQTAQTPPMPANAAPAAAPAPVEAPAAPVVPWDRSFAEGMTEIRRLAESGSVDEAVAIAERLAVPNALARKVEELERAGGWRASAGRALGSFGDALDLVGPPPPVRAEAQFARAVAHSLGAQRATAEDERALRREQSQLAFESARLLAGPGTLRLDATYDQGLLAFAAGEEQRAKLPEISGQPPQPPAPPPPSAQPGSEPPKPPDPLKLARAAYVAARERFVERLRMDWRDADSQASVELCQRRLRELDEIEKKRQEEQQKKEQEQKDQQQDKDQKDQDKQDKDSKSDDKQDKQKPDEPQKQDPGQDPKQDEKKDEKPPADPKDAQKPEDAPKPEPKPVDPKDLPKMSKEEMLQLLERLEKIDDVQKELQEKLKRLRKVGVEKDW